MTTWKMLETLEIIIQLINQNTKDELLIIQLIFITTNPLLAQAINATDYYYYITSISHSEFDKLTRCHSLALYQSRSLII